MKYDAYPNTFELLKKRVRENGTTLCAVSLDELGFSRQTLRNKMIGKTPLFFDEAKAIAKYLGISLNDFS